MSDRRYDIDWLRVFVLFLLILYHVSIGFLPWDHQNEFIVNDESMPLLWVFMTMLNAWRTPFLFFVSGMGLYFAMRKRTGMQVLQDRTMRILLPLLFGVFVICPFAVTFAQKYYGDPLSYQPNTGHVWFLINLYAYVIITLPLFVFLKQRLDTNPPAFLVKMLQHRFGLFLCVIPLMLETALIAPDNFSTLAGTIHGYAVGLIAFVGGFVLISQKELFWQSLIGIRRYALAIGVSLYLVRLLVFKLDGMPPVVVALEGGCSMLAVMAYASIYANKSSRVLRYFVASTYAVYILHAPIQFALASYVLKLELAAGIKFLILLSGTYFLSYLLYELVRRGRWLRPFIGIPIGPPVKNTKPDSARTTGS